MFAPSFWDHLEDRLNLAVFDTNQEIRQMNLRLRDLALSREKHVTPLPAAQPIVQPIQTTEKPKMSITGAAHLADSIKAKIQSAKDRMAKTAAGTDTALAKLNSAADAADQVSSSIEKEADDLMAQLGQFTNGAPS